jgi:hypothetical protein
VPRDVRKGLPFRPVFLKRIAARLSLAAVEESDGDGKPQAFRTSGGTAVWGIVCSLTSILCSENKRSHLWYTEIVARTSLGVIIFSMFTLAANAQVKIIMDHNTGASINPEFKFKSVPPPARNDAATNARVMIVDGEADPNSAGVNALVDGVLPASDDQPRRNFFIAPGSGGARILIDLGRAIEVAQINSYSWHPNERAPQVYRVWASDGTGVNFNDAPRANVDPRSCGWKVIATVDTRSDDETKDGGQWGVSIADGRGSLGRIRYLLFDCYVTEVADEFGNTFYSEVDVIAKK